MTDRLHRIAQASALVGVAIVVTATACGAPRDPLESGRRLTGLLYRGVADSLPAAAIVDLAGDGDSVLVRWFLDRKIDSLGREWPPEVVLMLEGRAGVDTFLARLATTFGRELEVVDEGVYPYPQIRGAVEYDRIARFSGRADNTVTVGWLWRGDGTVIGGWIVPSTRAAPTEFAEYQTKAELRLPFDGEWQAADCGRKPQENYHVQNPPLRFACDFTVVMDGSLFRTDGKTNADYYCFGHPILAPAAGRVLVALDSFPENTPGRTPPGYRGPGNFVVIDHHTGEYSVLAHLRRGSVVVTGGQDVAAGAQIGECGNNGLSNHPHLHYQLQVDPRPGGSVAPAQFRRYRADGQFVDRGEPVRGQRIQNVGP
jgi:Peptidase family M23